MNKNTIIGAAVGALFMGVTPIIPVDNALIAAHQVDVYNTTDGLLHDGDCYEATDLKTYTIYHEIPQRDLVTASGTKTFPASIDYEVKTGATPKGCVARNVVSQKYEAIFYNTVKSYSKEIDAATYGDYSKPNVNPVVDSTAISVVQAITGL